MTANGHRSPRRGYFGQRTTYFLSILSVLLVFTLLFSPLLPIARAAAPAGEAAAWAAPAAGRSLIQQLPVQAPLADWTVCASGCDFTLIQEAIDDSAVLAGDTIMVMDAIHTEAGISVDKDVIIRGQGAKETIVQAAEVVNDGSAPGDAVFHIYDNTKATIGDMTVRHGGRLILLEVIDSVSMEREDQDVETMYHVNIALAFYGGGILVEGELNLENSLVTDNHLVLYSTIALELSATAPLTATAVAEIGTEQDNWLMGAGIFNMGTLTVTNSTVANNSNSIINHTDIRAEASGGVITQTATALTFNNAYGAGIYSEGNLHLANSTISNNRSYITSTVHASNEVDPGAARPLAAPPNVHETNIYRLDGTNPDSLNVETRGVEITLSNAPRKNELAAPQSVDYSSGSIVIHQNMAAAGIYSVRPATITFSTISANSAVVDASTRADLQIVGEAAVGGVTEMDALDSDITFDNSIVAAQAAGADCAIGSNSSAGYNMDSDGSCAFYSSGDLSNANVLLGALEDNGGQTPTQALLYGSAGIDRADPACPAGWSSTDQRGEARPVDGDGDSVARCDIGAVESTFEADVSVQGALAGQLQVDGQPGNTFTLTPGEVTAGGRLTATLTVENHGPRASESIANALELALVAPEALQADGAIIHSTQGSCDATLPADRSNPLLCQLGVLAPGEVATVTVGARVAPSLAEGATLQGQVSVSAVPVDPQPANNVADMSAVANRRADVRVTNTQTPALAFTGQPVTYTVVFANEGPSDADSATLSGTLPAALAGASWSCSATGGATCSATSGSGDIAQQLALPAGAALTFTINSTVNACASFETVATISTATDPYLANDSATAHNTLSCLFVPSLLSNVQP